MMVSCVKRQARPEKCRTSSESGFSLIEVSIGLMIIGILMAPIIAGYNLYIEKQQFRISNSVADIVSDSIGKYYVKNAKYPRPASPNVNQGDENFGTGMDPTIPLASIPDCTPTSDTVCKTTSNTYGGAVVLIGEVPFADLGLPFKTAMDGYGFRLTYAVTASLTDDTSFNDAAGAIEILGYDGGSIFEPPYSTVPNRAHFIVVSHGQNGKGAFSLSGARYAPCGTLIEGTEFENCNNDGRFRSNLDLAENMSLRNYAEGLNYFDDFTKFVPSVTSQLWSYIPNQGDDMRATNNGNIYVGECTSVPCIPKARVDVNGDVRASERILTSRICNKLDNNCVTTMPSTYNPRYYPTGSNPVGWFSPNMLTQAGDLDSTSTLDSSSGNTADSSTNGYTGAGIRCYDNWALRGIRNYDEICSGTGNSGDTRTAMLPTSYTFANSCTGGTFAAGITISGTTITFTCRAP